jgi:hypothetical protein
MMQSTTGFAGLTMPVFTAFGWAGEEAALKFALSQLELFVEALHADLPRPIKDRLPVHGLSVANQSVFLAASSAVEDDIYVTFNARPMSLEIQLILSDKEKLRKALKFAEGDLNRCHRLIADLGPEWMLRVQQMQVDEESGEATHYQDLFKDSIAEFSDEIAVAVLSKAAYFNGDAQWVTPIYVSRRIPSENAASMGTRITEVMGEMVATLQPLISFFNGETTQKVAKTKVKAKPKAVEVAPPELPADLEPEVGFTYVSELQPLHIRRGFVNLTPEHWPFFAANSRATTCGVTVHFSASKDKQSSVWRLLPDDQARLVLSPIVHQWLEDYFEPYDKIQLTARKTSDGEISLTLAAVA